MTQFVHILLERFCHHFWFFGHFGYWRERVDVHAHVHMHTQAHTPTHIHILTWLSRFVFVMRIREKITKLCVNLRWSENHASSLQWTWTLKNICMVCVSNVSVSHTCKWSWCSTETCHWKLFVLCCLYYKCVNYRVGVSFLLEWDFEWKDCKLGSLEISFFFFFVWTMSFIGNLQFSNLFMVMVFMFHYILETVKTD